MNEKSRSKPVPNCGAETRQSAENGCKYCLKNDTFEKWDLWDMSALSANLDGNIFTIEQCNSGAYLQYKFSYCPMCGRKLPEVGG